MSVLTVDEERYDRQIRLWGAEAQQNLRKANVLVIGITGLGSEIIKNVVLSGVNSMTLVDDRTLDKVQAGQLESQMLIPFDVKYNNDNKPNSNTTLADASIARCLELNPNVETTSLSQIPFDQIKRSKYQIIVACDQTNNVESEIYKSCQESNVAFLTGRTNGFFGMSVIDPGREYTCQVEKLKNEIGKLENDEKKQDDEDTTKQFQQKQLTYNSYDTIISKLLSTSTPPFQNFKWRQIKNINQSIIPNLLNFQNLPITTTNAQNLSKQLTGKNDFWTGKNTAFHNLENLTCCSTGQLAAVTAVVGGFMAQEVIRICSRKEAPFDNLFLFDGLNYKGDLLKI